MSSTGYIQTKMYVVGVFALHGGFHRGKAGPTEHRTVFTFPKTGSTFGQFDLWNGPLDKYLNVGFSIWNKDSHCPVLRIVTLSVVKSLRPYCPIDL
jgi:hypothetical protein